LSLETQVKTPDAIGNLPTYKLWGRQRQESEAISIMGLKHMPAPEELGKDISQTTIKRQNLLYNFITGFLLSEQGAARQFHQVGSGKRKETVKAENRAFIANRAVLIDKVKDSSLANLQNYRKKHFPNDELSANEIKLEADLKQSSQQQFEYQKILTIDISGLKLIDNAGEGDRALNDVALKMIEISDFLQKKYEDGKILAFRPGGDEFSFTIESDDEAEFQEIIDYINTTAITEGLGSIQAKYATLDSSGNVTSLREGPIQIKNGKAFDESRPVVLENDETSEIRALLYDIILAEINLIPESSHIDHALEDIESQPGGTTREKFNNYFKEHWDHIVSVETSLPNFKDPNSVSDEEVSAEIEKICSEFPGLSMLFHVATKTDASFSDDVKLAVEKALAEKSGLPAPEPKPTLSLEEKRAKKANPDNPEYNIYRRDTLQLVSKFLFDPVLGEKIYNKHAFDQLVEFNQLSGLVIFKEVIKGINDKLGLVNGDAVIRKFYETIKAKIPENLSQYIVYGRGQADILIGFNTQTIEKLPTAAAKKEVIDQINDCITKLQTMDSFNCQIKKGAQTLDFNLNMGVGASTLDQDSKTGALKPPKMGQCYDLAEADFNLKYLQKMSKWGISKLSETVFNWSDKSDKEIEQIRNSDPDLWNLAIMLNDPKRAVLNSSKLLNAFKINFNSRSFRSIPENDRSLLLESLKLFTKKVEIQANLKRLNEEVAGLGIDGWDIFKQLKKGLKDSEISQLEMDWEDNVKMRERFLQTVGNQNQQ
jgi:GGDEF domain-containing protein